MGVRWIDEPPAVEVTGDGVKVTLVSGDETWSVRFSRHTYRRYIMAACAALDAADECQNARLHGIHGVCPFPPDERCR